MISLARDFGIKSPAKVHTDSNAAMGITHRRGVGRTRHIDVQYLWIQVKIGNKSVDIEKVDTKLNIADLMTKHLPAESMHGHLQSMQMYFVSGRSDLAPSLKRVSDCLHGSYLQCALRGSWGCCLATHGSGSARLYCLAVGTLYYSGGTTDGRTDLGVLDDEDGGCGRARLRVEPKHTFINTSTHEGGKLTKLQRKTYYGDRSKMTYLERQQDKQNRKKVDFKNDAISVLGECGMTIAKEDGATKSSPVSSVSYRRTC